MLTRFAPAPTGWLHLGHVVNAIHVWGIGRRHHADVLLRIEDHDRQRSRVEYERGLLDDLDWLGFAPDRFPTTAFRSGPCASRQQDRHAIYAAAAERLASEGLLYGCTCSRSDRVPRHGDAGARGDAGCPGRCRARGVTTADAPIWRVRLPASTESFEDLLVGPQTWSSEPDADDLVLRDRLGNWTYQFAVVVDDLDQGIDLVIRGLDLLASTGRQIQLGRALGRPAPATFAHHALVMKTATKKLSKSDGDSGIRALAQQGWSPDRVIGEAAHRVGLVVAGQRVRAHEVLALFD